MLIFGDGGIVVIKTQGPKREQAEEVARRKTAGLCLLCDSKPRKLGLCDKHYQRYRLRRRSLATDLQRAEYDAAAIREGKRLAGRQGRRIKEPDEYEELAERIAGKS